MRWKPLAAGLAIIYAACLVGTAPATLLDAALQHSSGGKLRLAEARGLIWSGSGQLELRDAAGRHGVSKPLTWRLALSSTQLAYDIDMDHLPMHLALSLAGLELGEANIDLPAAALGLAIAKLAPLELKGDLQLRIIHLSYGRHGVSGIIVLRWIGASSAHSHISPLGEYELRLDLGEKSTLATLHTLAGPLQIDGKGSWNEDISSAFQATLSVPPAHREQLAPLLGLIALDHGGGNFELSVKSLFQ